MATRLEDIARTPRAPAARLFELRDHIVAGIVPTLAGLAESAVSPSDPMVEATARNITEQLLRRYEVTPPLTIPSVVYPVVQGELVYPKASPTSATPEVGAGVCVSQLARLTNSSSRSVAHLPTHLGTVRSLRTRIGRTQAEVEWTYPDDADERTIEFVDIDDLEWTTK